VPRCAACLAEFVKTDRKVAADTEVFHEHCITRIPQSLGNKLKLRVIQLQNQLKTLEAITADRDQLRTALEQSEREARAARNTTDRMRAERDEAQTRSSTFQSSNAFREEQLTTAQQENERLARELENVRNELKLMQEIGKQPATPKTTQTSEPSDMWSDIEARFGLLELD
jgi:chromosome segregation ATPase